MKAHDANWDGWAESVADKISNRCLDRDYPDVSDLLGSDWAAGYPFQALTPGQYKDRAMNHAFRIRPSYWAG